ncbi:MAG: SDR family oxidoreductase, partial [SAR324 cluster bacterium]|nr:SDR family oxidoreductase [SAR324 cluster bacterium]
VAEAKDVERMVHQTVATFGRLDVACNNAGIEGNIASIIDCDEATFDRTMAVNVRGVWLCMKYQLPVMLKQGGGSIVNTASVAGLFGSPKMGAYIASKHAVIGLTKTAALEVGRSHIRVNAVCPGVIETEMALRGFGDNVELTNKMKAVNPSKRFGQPQEVAKAILWLSSDEASYINGHSLVIDGGLTIQ